MESHGGLEVAKRSCFRFSCWRVFLIGFLDIINIHQYHHLTFIVRYITCINVKCKSIIY
jgi:hypothetical protein